MILCRDVKAGNLLVDLDGTVQLADFGVASSLQETGDRQRGRRKTFVGTPCWMAPEVMQQQEYDSKADIWSFGITAYELATGKAPYAAFPPMKVLMMTINNDSPTLDRDRTRHKYSKLFKEMIDLCLEKEPQRRPTAEKLLQHSFFKLAKKKIYLTTTILKDLPPLAQRQGKRREVQPKTIPKMISWDFDLDELKAASKSDDPVLADALSPTSHIQFNFDEKDIASSVVDDTSSASQRRGRFVMESGELKGNSSDDAASTAAANETSVTSSSGLIRKKGRFTMEEEIQEEHHPNAGEMLTHSFLVTQDDRLAPSGSDAASSDYHVFEDAGKFIFQMDIYIRVSFDEKE